MRQRELLRCAGLDLWYLVGVISDGWYSRPDHQRCLLIPRDEALCAELSEDLKKQGLEFA